MAGGDDSDILIRENETAIRNLKESNPCRDKQIDLLFSMFRKTHHAAYPALFIYGHTATGKSVIVDGLMSTLKLPHVIVNCVECYNQKLVYERILNQLSGELSLLLNGTVKCDNMNNFIRQFRQILQDRGIEKEAIYIVLDKADRLRDMETNLLPAFLKLQELSGRNTCTIMVSEIVWEKFRPGSGGYEPYIINFPDYSKDEMIDVMSQDCAEECPRSFFTAYVSLVLSVFYMVCRDLRELRHLALLNFPKYMKPIISGEATYEDTRKLWRNIEPHLKKALQTVYLREVSSSQWERLQTVASGNSQLQTLKGCSSRAHVELPFYTKYLLIAAYLASYNPAKSDKRFFSKGSAKVSKKAQLVKKHERTSNQLLGPKPFPLDRLMAIFYSIVEGRVAPTANIFMQISSLVTLHLLVQIAGDDQLDSPKYKCLVSLDFIKGVARTVNFEVVGYLYDFI